MIISNIDKKPKLGVLLSMFNRALFYLIKRRKKHVTSDVNDIISLKNQQNIFLIEDEEAVFVYRKKEINKNLLTLYYRRMSFYKK